MRRRFHYAPLIASFRVLTIAAVVLALDAPRLRAQAPLPTPQAPPPSSSAPLPSAAGAPSYPDAELDRIVSPIALYPDPLLAQVLAAASYWDQIPDAARWADTHHYLSGPALNAAIAGDRLIWEPPVQALLPFPSVLGMMASAMPWTQEIGDAFLAEPDHVMDAVQRMRQESYRYGYLRSNAEVMVRTGPTIEIAPVNPGVIVVPYYDPAVVFVAPRRGVIVGHAITFGVTVPIGPVFASWGWGTTHFDWGRHVLVLNNAPWRRTWATRTVYVHPYTQPRYTTVAHRAEEHRLVEESARERAAAQAGRKRTEEHRAEQRREAERRAKEHKDNAKN